MPLPLNLCDDHHQAIAFLGDCPLCRKFESAAYKQQFSSQVSAVTFVPQLESALKESYGRPE